MDSLIALIRGLTVAWLIVVISASFGVATVNTLHALLFFTSLIYLVLDFRSFRFFTFEKLSLIFITSMIFCSFISIGLIESLIQAADKYRFYWTAPILAIVLTKIFTQRDLLTIILVGSFFNITGSALIALKIIGIDYFWFIFDGNKIENASLGGKFVQTLVAPLIVIAFCSRFRESSFCTSLLLLAFLIQFMFLVNSLFGLVMVLMIGGSILVTEYWNHKRIKDYVIGAIALFAPLSVMAIPFLSNYIHPSSSFGVRLGAWQALFETASDKILFGYGLGGLESALLQWHQLGLVHFHLVEWNDPHSELIEIIIAGGLFSLVTFYLYLGALAWKVRACWGSAHNTCGLFGVYCLLALMIFGVFNTVLANGREASCVAIGLIMFSVGLRDLKNSDREKCDL